MFDVGDNVIVIKEETYDTIKIYGFGVVDEVIDFDGEHTYVVKLEEDAGRYVIEADNLVSTHDWVEYVDERCANVIRVPYEAWALVRNIISTPSNWKTAGKGTKSY